MITNPANALDGDQDLGRAIDLATVSSQKGEIGETIYEGLEEYGGSSAAREYAENLRQRERAKAIQ